MRIKIKEERSGFTLVEGLVVTAVFAIFAISIQQILLSTTKIVKLSRQVVDSASLANEQFEIIHNLPYDDVGLLNGIPDGKLQASQIITRDKIDFLVETTIRNIDDPFDGVLEGSPNDTSPADYKLAELTISIPGNPEFQPLSYTEIIAPQSLENSSDNGALFVRVFNASGQPISGADVHIENNETNPEISINDITNTDGYLQIVDAPPAASSYEISVAKNGYSSEQTYQIGAADNPNPVKPHATIAAQTVTQISFSIDETGSLDIESVTDTCTPVAGIAFNLKGDKLIGSSPDILKFNEEFSTGSEGHLHIGDLEWDTYGLTVNDSVYDLAGSNSIIPINLLPGGNQEVKLVVAPKNPNSLLVSVKQGGTNLPLSGATVRMEKDGFSQELITGRGFLRQSDWSGGGGQENFSDQTKYYSSDGNIDTGDPEGEIKLYNVFGLYSGSGVLESSSFDTGSASNFYQLYFYPQDQPPETGADNVRLQIATNNDNATWDFLGPDGTASTYYDKNNLNINSLHNNDRYLKYKIYLQTASSTYTPNISEVNFTFSSLCVPSGQVMFTGLEAESYTLTVEKNSFQPLTENLNISDSWRQYEVTLMPE
jgi:hypothetical protein